MTLSEAIETSSKRLFRFEGLQDYSAEDGEAVVREFVETGTFSVLPSAVPWWQEMKRKHERGIVTERVRLVTLPLTDYTNMELAWHREAAAYSGDDIRVIAESQFKQLFPEGLSDFWLIDETSVFVMEYGPRGKFLGSQLVTGGEADIYSAHVRKLLTASVVVAEYRVLQ